MNKSGFIFCIATLAGTLGVAWVLFPLAALSPEEVLAANTPLDAELFDDVTVRDFGQVSVLDMVLHYVDNPPLESESESTKVRFQGC